MLKFVAANNRKRNRAWWIPLSSGALFGGPGVGGKLETSRTIWYLEAHTLATLPGCGGWFWLHFRVLGAKRSIVSAFSDVFVRFQKTIIWSINNRLKIVENRSVRTIAPTRRPWGSSVARWRQAAGQYRRIQGISRIAKRTRGPKARRLWTSLKFDFDLFFFQDSTTTSDFNYLLT